jgi:hypothetical protein
MLGGVVLAIAVLTGCGSGGDPEIQAGVDNGGLTGGGEGTAQHIAKRQVRRQHIDLMKAVALAYDNPSSQARPRVKSCPTGPLIRLVLEGTFPGPGPAVKAEEIYSQGYLGHGHYGACAARYLEEITQLPSGLGTLYVPGTASTGE